MKPKTMILAVVAVGCGLVASYMTSRLIAERNQPQEAEPQVKVLVARGRIPAHTLFKESELSKYFVEKEVREKDVPRKAIRNLSDLKDKRNSKPISEDNFITLEDLVDSKTEGLAASLPPGMRAVAIRVNPESMAGGHVLIGSHVDVLSSVKGDVGTRSMTILQDMLVLAVDLRSIRNPDDPQAAIGNTVTLAAWPDEVEFLTAAAGSGELRLSLRPVGDKEKVRLKGATTRDLGRQREEGERPGENPPADGTGPNVPPAIPGTGRDPVVIDDKKPEDKKPEDKKPEDRKPEDKKPEDKKPEDKKPEDKRAEDKKPETEKTDNKKYHVMTIVNGLDLRTVQYPLTEGKPDGK